MVTLISRGVGVLVVMGLAFIGLNTVTKTVKKWKAAYDGVM